MKFLGQVEASAFMRDYPAEAETLRAWIAEIRCGRWDSPRKLSADYRNVDVSCPPRVIFRFAGAPIQVETVIDFRIGVVLVTDIQKTRNSANPFLQYGNA
jgi:mRNA-degrading endonuclease HigB of HigAB toxin-antitoxin module